MVKGSDTSEPAFQIKGSYSDSELDAIAASYFCGKATNLKHLLELPVEAQAYLGRSKAFRAWLDSRFFAASIPGSAVRVSQSESRAARWFMGSQLKHLNGKRGNGSGESLEVQTEGDDE